MPFVVLRYSSSFLCVVTFCFTFHVSYVVLLLMFYVLMYVLCSLTFLCVICSVTSYVLRSYACSHVVQTLCLNIFTFKYGYDVICHGYCFNIGSSVLHMLFF